MSRKGNGWDNAPTESGFNRFKNERVHGNRFTRHADMKAVSFEYIGYDNTERRHSSLDNLSPAAFEQRWHGAASPTSAGGPLP